MGLRQSSQLALPCNAQEVPQEGSRKDREGYNYSSTKDINGGTNMSGQVTGGIFVQGNYIACGQLPTTSTSTPSQPSTENWQQKLEM
uniref:Uncharacterized protein n=1 Tax=Plectus sambesii TaxID=2011161 RepID=A0A914X4H3_9BILA